MEKTHIGKAAGIHSDVPAKIMRLLERAPILPNRPGNADREQIYRFVQRVATAWGGRCLSPTYPDSTTPLRFECSEGHQFTQLMSSIRRGAWCRQCHLARRWGKPVACFAEPSIELMQQLAAEKGGRCLSRVYGGLLAPLEWECAKSHRWQVAPRTIRAGHWCRVCSDESKRMSLSTLQAIAISRGGRCLSTTYRKQTNVSTWECAKGHAWIAVAADVVKRTWCPHCKDDGKRSSIEAMQALAAKRGGQCLSMVYVNRRKPLEWACAKGHRWMSPADRIMFGAWCGVCANDAKRNTISDMQERAAKHGGVCLSTTYVNSVVMLEWQCAQGHRWWAVPGPIAKGTWCPQCAREHRRRHQGQQKKPKVRAPVMI